jgi:hypothetical protein
MEQLQSTAPGRMDGDLIRIGDRGASRPERRGIRIWKRQVGEALSLRRRPSGSEALLSLREPVFRSKPSLRRLDLNFYEGASLFELEVGRPKERLGILAYIRFADQTVLVNGKSDQIHELSANAPIRSTRQDPISLPGSSSRSPDILQEGPRRAIQPRG